MGYHQFADRRARDAALADRMEALGFTIIRLIPAAAWDETSDCYSTLFRAPE
jgi:hypothetical protein